MEYLEWIKNGELNNPFTNELIQKLKLVIESNNRHPSDIPK